MDSRLLSVTDDSGFLALVDSDAYSGFVGEYWDWPGLLARFQCQMDEHHLLIWGTGLENTWRVRVQFEPVSVGGYREMVGSVTAVDGWLLLTNYEGLLGPAMDEDAQLPEPRQRDLLLRVEPGVYRCRVIQLHDHEYSEGSDEALEEAEAHYVVELLLCDAHEEPWRGVPWAAV